jgi:hypothetical protein
MSNSKLGIFANLALAASAVLIPPTISMGDLGDDKALEGLVTNPFKQSFALDCPGCALATVEKDTPNTLAWEQGVGNAFVSLSLLCARRL